MQLWTVKKQTGRIEHTFLHSFSVQLIKQSQGTTSSLLVFNQVSLL